MPEWVSTFAVMFDQSLIWVVLALVVSLLVVRFLWKKMKRMGMKILVLALTLPLSTGVGFASTAISFAKDYDGGDKSISKIYEEKKAEITKLGSQK